MIIRPNSHLGGSVKPNNEWRLVAVLFVHLDSSARLGFLRWSAPSPLTRRRGSAPPSRLPPRGSTLPLQMVRVPAPPPRLSSSSSPDSIARAATCVGVSGFLIRPDPSRSSPVSSPPAPSYGACVCSLFGFGRLGSPFLGFHGRCKSGSRLLLVSWWRCFDGLLVQESCPSVKNILLLDSEGKRVAVKYYTDDWPTLSAKLAFEKSVFVKTQKATAGAEGNAHLPPLSACDSEWQLRRWLVSDD